MIYFIQADGSGAIKIGHAARPEKRLGELRVASSHVLKLLATMEGDRIRETELHARFSRLRIRGEWFKPAPALIEFIQSEGVPFVSAPRKVRLSKTGQPRKGSKVVARNLLRLGHADIAVRCGEVAALIVKNTGKKISRQRISAIMKAAHVEGETIALIAKGLGVKPEELTLPADPPPSPRPRGRRG